MSLNLIAMEISEVPINRDSIKGTPGTENPQQSGLIFVAIGTAAKIVMRVSLSLPNTRGC